MKKSSATMAGNERVGNGTITIVAVVMTIVVISIENKQLEMFVFGKLVITSGCASVFRATGPL